MEQFSAPYSINVNGRLVTFSKPLVMGILNATDNSFYAPSRVAAPQVLVQRAKDMLAAGAAMLDVGACSTRPGSKPVTQQEELARLHTVLDLLDKELPQAIVSVDTFRGTVARECVARHNVAIINDVSGFDWDSDMFAAAVELGVPYVLTHTEGVAGELPAYSDFLPQVLKKLAAKMWQLRQEGVADIIVDPGFGFGKNLEQNYAMLASLQEFHMLEAPVLVGISRKSMITKLLGIDADDALSATTALNMAALSRGASILRVHDVKEAVQAVELHLALKNVSL